MTSSKSSRSAVYAHTVGSLDQGRAAIGKRSVAISGPFAVDSVRIAQFCAMIEDDNERYWADRAGKPERTPRQAPPASLQLWIRQLPWTPDGEVPRSMLATVPLPGESMINVSTDIEYFRPILVGDWISAKDWVTDISDLND